MAIEPDALIAVVVESDEQVAVFLLMSQQMIETAANDVFVLMLAMREAGSLDGAHWDHLSVAGLLVISWKSLLPCHQVEKISGLPERLDVKDTSVPPQFQVGAESTPPKSVNWYSMFVSKS